MLWEGTGGSRGDSNMCYVDTYMYTYFRPRDKSHRSLQVAIAVHVQTRCGTCQNRVLMSYEVVKVLLAKIGCVHRFSIELYIKKGMRRWRQLDLSNFGSLRAVAGQVVCG